MQALRSAAAAMALALASATVATAAPRHAAAETRPDLADTLVGSWDGSVISDARGGSHDGVRVTVTRLSHNLVQVESDYPRLPTVQIPLESAMKAILSRSPKYVVVYMRDRPDHLELTLDDASWSGDRAR